MKSLSAFSGGKKLLSDVDLELESGSIHLVMGPNGAGKSTLARAIMGHPDLECKGTVTLEGKDILKMSTDERARSGIFLSFQKPEEIDGLSVSRFIRKAKTSVSGKSLDMDALEELQSQIESNAKMLGINPDMISRSLNVGFSGGEKKRIEMLQALLLNPKLLVFDEIDSGLDVDGVRLISESLNKMRDKKKSFLIITHYPRMQRYIKPDVVHVMVGGRVVETGGTKLSSEIEENGYSRWTS